MAKVLLKMFGQNSQVNSLHTHTRKQVQINILCPQTVGEIQQRADLMPLDVFLWITLNS